MPNTRRRLTGEVVSAKMQKTIVVSVATTRRHRLYGKVISTKKKYLVHDEHNQARPGDVVRIVESRPISRRKRWVLEAIERGGHSTAELREDVAALDAEVEEVTE
ncbi:MAG: 30S ribosomal protein S17 [Anaerolineae bacterium]|nr:30S ribosomal protein S17 [Anaerolineae bacterium]